MQPERASRASPSLLQECTGIPKLSGRLHPNTPVENSFSAERVSKDRWASLSYVQTPVGILFHRKSPSPHAPVPRASNNPSKCSCINSLPLGPLREAANSIRRLTIQKEGATRVTYTGSRRLRRRRRFLSSTLPPVADLGKQGFMRLAVELGDHLSRISRSLGRAQTFVDSIHCSSSFGSLRRYL